MNFAPVTVVPNGLSQNRGFITCVDHEPYLFPKQFLQILTYVLWEYRFTIYQKHDSQSRDSRYIQNEVPIIFIYKLLKCFIRSGFIT